MQTPNKKKKIQDQTELKKKRRVVPFGYYDSSKPLIRSDYQNIIPQPNRTQTSSNKIRNVQSEKSKPNNIESPIKKNNLSTPQAAKQIKVSPDQQLQNSQVNEKGQIIIQIIVQQPGQVNEKKTQIEEEIIIRYPKENNEAETQPKKYKVIVQQVHENNQQQIDQDGDGIKIFSPQNKYLNFSDSKYETSKKIPLEVSKQSQKSPIFEPRLPYPKINQNIIKQSNDDQSPPRYTVQKLAPYFSNEQQYKLNNEFSNRSNNQRKSYFNTNLDFRLSPQHQFQPVKCFLSSMQTNKLSQSLSQPWLGPKQYKYDVPQKQSPVNLNGDVDSTYIMPDNICLEQNKKQIINDGTKRNIQQSSNFQDKSFKQIIADVRNNPIRTSERKRIFSPLSTSQSPKKIYSPGKLTPFSIQENYSPLQQQSPRMSVPIFETKGNQHQINLQNDIFKIEIVKHQLHSQIEKKKSERQKWYKGGQLVS